MGHKCSGGFITVNLNGMMLELCEPCAHRFIEIGAELDFMLRGESRPKLVYLSEKEREKRMEILSVKVFEVVGGGEAMPNVVFFAGMTDEDLVRLTDDPYIESGTDDD